MPVHPRIGPRNLCRLGRLRTCSIFFAPSKPFSLTPRDRRTKSFLIKDAKTQDAVLRRFLVAGEAAARLSPETCAKFPGIPFPKIVGMRNRVVHDYGNVDFEIVWETIQTHLRPLFEELQRFFAGRGEG